jgi:hypothetical protein
MSDATNAHKKKLREWLRKYKTGLRCKQCGEDHIACLEFHHRDPSLKHKKVSQMPSEGYSVDSIMAEIAKCDVLCANCHAKLHYDNRT